ncbi:MAG TPA: hypothetical protein VFV95_03090 [Vicinamibacterales bacterium]|nr:hypothetical protein [Vicinamibacterales bacterium]
MADMVNPAEQPDQEAVREVFRAKHRLAVSVMERPQEYTFAYSLGDIHRLTFLSHRERREVQAEWEVWHRKYVRLGGIGLGLWVAGALAAWAFWFRAAPLSVAIQQSLGLSVPAGWFTGLAIVTTLGLLMALPAFLATTYAGALSDSYLRGYTDGLTRGVNRALHITPEIEQQMWEELRRAERLDASWRRVTDTPPQE